MQAFVHALQIKASTLPQMTRTQPTPTRWPRLTAPPSRCPSLPSWRRPEKVRHPFTSGTSRFRLALEAHVASQPASLPCRQARSLMGRTTSRSWMRIWAWRSPRWAWAPLRRWRSASLPRRRRGRLWPRRARTSPPRRRRRSSARRRSWKRARKRRKRKKRRKPKEFFVLFLLFPYFNIFWIVESQFFKLL